MLTHIVRCYIDYASKNLAMMRENIETSDIASLKTLTCSFMETSIVCAHNLGSALQKLLIHLVSATTTPVSQNMHLQRVAEELELIVMFAHSIGIVQEPEHITVKDKIGPEGSVPGALAAPGLMLCSTTEDAPKTVSPDVGKPMVLVVDDSKSQTMALTHALRAQGVGTAVAEDGEDAVHEMTSKYAPGLPPYQLIFMDLHMPFCSGLKATTRIREYEKLSGQRYTPIVGLTANADSLGRPDPAEVEECVKLGMCDLTTKPLKPHLLKTYLEDYVLANSTLDEAPAAPPEGQADLAVHSQPAPVAPAAPAPAPAPASGLPVPVEELDQSPVEDPPISIENAMAMHGDFEFLQELLEAFVPDAATRIRELLATEDPDAIKMHAHTLKGASSVVCAEELTATCRALEASLDALLPDVPAAVAACLQHSLRARRILEALVAYLHDIDIDIAVTIPDVPMVAPRVPAQPAPQAVLQVAPATSKSAQNRVAKQSMAPAPQQGGAEDAVAPGSRRPTGLGSAASPRTSLPSSIAKQDDELPLQSLDIQVAMENAGGDYNVMVSMVRSFLHMLKKVVKTMKCPQLGEEAAGVMAKINCIKSMSAMVGASKLVACCEASMKDQTPRTAQSIATLAETMQDELQQLRAYMHAIGMGQASQGSSGGEDDEGGSHAASGAGNTRDTRARPSSSGDKSRGSVSCPASRAEVWKAPSLLELQQIALPAEHYKLYAKRQLRVATVSHDAVFRRALGGLLEGAGHASTLCDELSKPLPRAWLDNDGSLPDLVLVHTSGVQGLERATTLRREWQMNEVPFLALVSAEDHQSVASSSLCKELDDILTVPRDLPVVLRRVNVHMAAIAASRLQKAMPGMELTTIPHELNTTHSEKAELQKQHKQVMEELGSLRERESRAKPVQSPAILDTPLQEQELARSSMFSEGLRSAGPPVWKPQDHELNEFLCGLGLGHFAFQLESNAISINVLALMTDEDMASVGLHSVGARILIQRGLKELGVV